MIDYNLDKPKYIVHNAHLYKLVEGEKEMRKFYNYCVKRDKLIRESIMESMFINKEYKNAKY